MIKPSIGRVLWFTPATAHDSRHDKTQPLAGIVSYVWSDKLVNLTVSNQDGSTQGCTSVRLVQPEEDPASFAESGYFATWMPFQIGQAKANG